ncbi:hypothetical protein D9Q98_010554 [Chlorella vulgaris]|uniref:Uncharacterized protein n=1 Tax=Chlorella vulgaris TaxID=3077 RepID=A0A9D4TQM7_CHLVU|nr:hypothetical protein D9Q98_010554 [Chlorella vulgaris]
MPAESAGTSEAATSQRDTQDAGTSCRRALTAAAVLTLLSLLATSTVTSRPLLLVRPPITRRVSGFFQFEGGDCPHLLAQGSWTDQFRTVRCEEATQQQYATCGDTPQRHWRFSKEAAACGAQRLTRTTAGKQLAGQRLVFAGDSIARNLYAAMLRLLGDPAQSIVVGHADFQHELEGSIMLQFYWAPYPANLTALLTRQLALEGKVAAAGGAAAAGTAGISEQDVEQDKEEQQAVQEQEEQEEETIKKEQGEKGEQQQQAEQEEDQEVNGEEQQQQKEPEKEEDGVEKEATATRKRRRLQDQKDPAAQPKQQPSLVLLSSTLWHMLHIKSADDFAAQLKKLAAACGAYVDAASAAQGAAAAPHLLLASSTETFPNRMRTEVKQQRMTPSNVDSYNQALAQAGVLAPAGPLHLLDLFPLTQHCGEECSTDGVHSLPEVYDAALQLMLNVAAAGNKAQPRRRLWQRLPGRSRIAWLQTLKWR